MANRRNYTRHSHMGIAIFCVILALVLAAGLTIGGLQLFAPEGKKIKPSEWFREDAVIVEKENVKYNTTLPANGGMTLPDEVEDGEEDDTGVKSNGIALMSATIPVAQYATYGISPAAETAKTVTATVSPDNEASNTKIKWELSWKDAASEWATGKEVTDYVTIQSNADDLMESKTCTVSCSQAFGEQIQLKAICVEDETKFATCNVDYVQQIKSASVAIGDVSVNLGGNTDITIAIRRDYGGTGGKVTVTPTYGDVYTIENEFTATATITAQNETVSDVGDANRKYFNFSHGSLHALRLTVDTKNYVGESIYFDTRFFEQFGFTQLNIKKDGTLPIDENFSQLYPETADTAGWLYWKNFTANEIKDCYTNLHCQGKILWTMKVTLTSDSYEYEYTYESDIVWAAIDETVPLGDVSINKGQGLIFP